jgi:hypothetical protein
LSDARVLLNNESGQIAVAGTNQKNRVLAHLANYGQSRKIQSFSGQLTTLCYIDKGPEFRLFARASTDDSACSRSACAAHE